MASASEKGVRLPGNKSRPAARDDILKLLDKKDESVEDTKDLWNKLESMRDDKGLIKLLKEKRITRIWEKAVGTDIDIADLMVPNDKALKDLRDKTVKAPNDPGVKARLATAVDAHAAAAIKAMLPQPGEPHVKWIGKRGEKKRGWDSFLFPWARSSKGFPFKEDFEMTISNGDNPNEYYVHIGGDNSNEHRAVDIGGEKSILLSVKRTVDHVPEAVKRCVAVFTFGDGSNTVTNQIIVYIRFASPTVLVGKAFKANLKDEDKYKELWGDLILAKSN